MGRKKFKIDLNKTYLFRPLIGGTLSEERAGEKVVINKKDNGLYWGHFLSDNHEAWFVLDELEEI